MTKRIISNLQLLFFVNGFLLASLIYLRKEDLYERDLFIAIVNKIKSELKTNDKDTFLIKSLNMTYYLQERRQEVFSLNPIYGTDNNDILHSATEDLMAVKGSCGSYSMVLARILKSNACEVRIGQMKVDGKFGGHIIVETKIKDRWIVVDPMFNVFFINPEGHLASFKEVNQNWAFYSKQLPANYPASFRYEGIRYTNWNKIPVIMPIVKKLLDITMGKESADNFSIRPKIIRIHHFLFVIGLWIYFPLTALTFWLYWKRRKNNLNYLPSF